MERPDYDTTRAQDRRAVSRPPANERPYLIGVAGEHAGSFFPIEGLRVLDIGRTAECEIPVFMDDLVSRRHVRVEMDDTLRVWLNDLDSTNGTLVNGREVTRPVLLNRGDRIYLGESTILKFDYLSDDEVQRWNNASVDALTECFNRALFEDRYPEIFELCSTRGRALSVLMVDIDHFKRVNDRHGHQAGDFALQHVAAAVLEHLREVGSEALAFRYGGEEFAVVAPGVDAGGCRALADGIRQRVEKSLLEFEGSALRLTVSIGTATLTPGVHEAADALVRAADANLYRAKNEGRNRVVS